MVEDMKRVASRYMLMCLFLSIHIFFLGVFFNNKEVTAASNEVTNLQELFAPSVYDGRPAIINGNTVQATDGKGYTASALWTKEKIDFNRSWVFKADARAADAGVMVAFQSISNTYLGGQGGNNGLYNKTNTPAMIVIEIDMFNNGEGIGDYGNGNYPHNPALTYKHFNIVTMFTGKQPVLPKALSLTLSPIVTSDGSVRRSQFVAISTAFISKAQPVEYSWDSLTNTLTAVTVDNGVKKTVTATYTNQELVNLFGASKTAYLGITGAEGQMKGLNSYTFKSFRYLGYDPESKIELTHTDGILVSDVAPAHKYSTIHVKETIVNKSDIPGIFPIKYRLNQLYHLDKATIANFTVNGVSTTYVDNMVFSDFSHTTPYVIEFDINVKQGTSVFDDVTSAPKVGYESVITSELAGETKTEIKRATKNDAPTLTAEDFSIVQDTVLTDQDYQEKAKVVASDLEDGASVTVSVNKSGVNLSAPGTYPVIFTVTDQEGKKTTKTIEVTVLSAKAVVTVQFLNELGTEMTDYTVTIDTVFIGDSLDLSAHSTIQEKIGLLEANGYEIVTRPPNETSLNITNPTMTVQYHVRGLLLFQKAPTKIDFGVHEAGSYGQYTTSNPSYDSPLIVSDQRAVRTKWTLTATVTEVMTSVSDSSYTLPHALVYKSDAGEEPLDLNQARIITEHTHTANGGYNVSDEEWETKNNGFKMKLQSTDYRKMDDYRATILFTVGETP